MIALTHAQPSENSFLWHMQFAIQQLFTQVLNPTTESKRAVKQLIRYLKGTQHTCLRFEPREMVQTGLLELVGRSGSDWTGDSATRQRLKGYHCDVQNVTMRNRSLKRQRTVSVHAKQSSTQPVLAQENCWDSQNSSRNFTATFPFAVDSDLARHILQRRGPGGLKHIETRCLAIQQWIREKRPSVSRVDTKNNTADPFTNHVDGLRTQSLAKKLGLRILDGTSGTNGDD